MEEKKDLRKLTEFEDYTFNSTQGVREYLEKNPGKLQEVKSVLYRQLDESYKKELCKEDMIVEMIEVCDLQEGKESSIRNATYEYNHSLITACIHNWIIEHRSFPTSQHIADKVGLSRQTVHKHLKEGSFSRHQSLIKGKTEYMASQALANLYLIGVEERNVSALKAFIEHSGATNGPASTINNYIQINNLKLSKDDFDQLQPETLTRLERIISTELKKDS